MSCLPYLLFSRPLDAPGVGSALQKAAHYLLGTLAVVAGERRDALLHAQLVDVILKLAHAGAQLVNLTLALQLALAHVKNAHHTGQVDSLVMSPCEYRRVLPRERPGVTRPFCS